MSLLLSDEEICKSICHIQDGEELCQHKCKRYIDFVKAQNTQLQKLKDRGDVYISKVSCEHYGKENYEPCYNCEISCFAYIPLSEYIKEED